MAISQTAFGTLIIFKTRKLKQSVPITITPCANSTPNAKEKREKLVCFN